MQKKFYAFMATVMCGLAQAAAAQSASVSVDASVSSGSPAIVLGFSAASVLLAAPSLARTDEGNLLVTRIAGFATWPT